MYYSVEPGQKRSSYLWALEG